jgi:predicted ATP-grasp superfamily ATP-dependent carboligase
VFDPTDLYRLDDDIPELTDPVLLYHFEGFVDAGATGRLAMAHLLAKLEHRVIVTFDHDRLLDYRSRRPIMIFDTDRWVDCDTPSLAIHLVHDLEGTPFLVMTGPEPDREWELFVRAVRSVSERLGVSRLVTAHGIPMAVPHTRPLGLTAHGSKPEVLESVTGPAGSPFGRVQVPASVAALIEYRLGAEGYDALGFAVHVPHYLAQAEYPQSAVTALDAISLSTGLIFPMDELRAVAETTTAEIQEQIQASEELATAIKGLEQQYDAFTAGAGRENLMAENIPMPTGEELAAQFERFLAERDERES